MKRVVETGVFLALGTMFAYETKKVVQIKSKKIGVIFRILQISIIFYLIGFVMVYKKGYQDTENVVSALVTKVKGVSFTNRSDMGQRIWDSVDYVVPALEQDAIFVTTTAVLTSGQTQGMCAEDPSVPDAICETDSDCPPLEPLMLGHGVMTGRCINATEFPGNHSTCEIYSWCPLEIDKKPDNPLLSNVPNFTILLKNSVEFPKFHKKRSNVLDSYNSSILSTCSFHPENDPYCPIFKVGTILDITGDDFHEIALLGGVIVININWDCNFDWEEKYCLPKYSFRRQDKKDTSLAKGWNFRYSSYYAVNGVQHRDLMKVYGIRFLIYVTGQGGQFNIIPFTMTLGSGLALLGIATVLCDMVVLYCLSRKERYRKAKYQTVYGEDAFRNSAEHQEASSVDVSVQDSLRRQRPPIGYLGTTSSTAVLVSDDHGETTNMPTRTTKVSA